MEPGRGGAEGAVPSLTHSAPRLSRVPTDVGTSADLPVSMDEHL